MPSSQSPVPSAQSQDNYQAVKEATDRLKAEAVTQQQLIQRQSEGERNVLAARIEALEKTAKDLTEQNGKLSKQPETAYQKVQEIAEKAVESSSPAKSMMELQRFLADQSRKRGGGEKP